MGTLILFLFALCLISIIGLSLSSARVEIRTLKARLDRRDALEAKRTSNCNPSKAVINKREKQLEAELEALEHTIALKDETIKHLNGDIAKLKFDYAAEVAGRNEPKIVSERGTFGIQTISDAEKSALLYGEWVDNAGPQKVREEKGCTDPDCSVCYGDKNAESPNLDEEVDD